MKYPDGPQLLVLLLYPNILMASHGNRSSIDWEIVSLRDKLQSQELCYSLVKDAISDLRANNRDLRFIIGFLEREVTGLHKDLEFEKAKTTRLEVRRQESRRPPNELRSIGGPELTRSEDGSPTEVSVPCRRAYFGFALLIIVVF